MKQTTRRSRLLIASAAALVLAFPVALARPAQAGSAHLPAQRRAAAPRPAAPARLTLPAALSVAAGVASSIPLTLQVPAGNVAYLAAHGTGVQLYTCTMTGTTFAWSSAVPAAALYNGAGSQIATHYAGPTWQATDGSSVVGHKLQSDTVASDAIPWLLLGATSTTIGPSGGATLSATTYIQRLLTRGGLAPAASACNAGTLGTTQSVPYTALYVFYQAIALAISQPIAAVGRSITVTGTDFQAGEPVQISWDVTGTTPLASGTADASGTFVATVQVPAGLTGAHTLLGIGQTSGAIDFAYLGVVP